MESKRPIRTEDVKLIRGSRESPALAHPARIRKLSELRSAGFVRLEVCYSVYSHDVTSRLLIIAEVYGLITTEATPEMIALSQAHLPDHVLS